jgi:transposase
MKQQNIFDPVPVERFEILSREELIQLAKLHQRAIVMISKDNDRLRALSEELKTKNLYLDEQFVVIKNKLFGKSSERIKRPSREAAGANANKKRVQLPSERYPNLPLIERDITLEHLPSCSCCGDKMSDSGMTEDSQYLTVVPAQYYVVLQKRHKYRCETCHGDIKTAPAPLRIKEGSSYSDEMMIDVSLAKYCDLIPIERYAAMAGRLGVKGLPPQSLIESSHYLADYARGAYSRLKDEVLESVVLHADETTHRMLEGDESSHWHLWGFSTPRTSYFEYHDTRSGAVASELLLSSKCRFLVSDVFSGYGKSVRDVNKIRAEKLEDPIEHAYCNAHARRKFKEAAEILLVVAEGTVEPEARRRAFLEHRRAWLLLNQYRKIYHLEGFAQRFPDKKLKIRLRLRKYFEKLREQCMADFAGYSIKSARGKSMSYFLKNYDNFVRFIAHPDVPIDNNPAERVLRNPVIGRKTWYGTHSKRGAETAAVLFSLVESCKLNRVNPREYFKKLVQDLQQGKSAFTPKEFADLTKN